ncbi:MAG: malL [Phycisphaerales bacterium]|nr:malL [Phycisphaerales bacterium]
MADVTHEWWQSGIVYQVYPRSFQDGNGDGVGDLAGVIDRLDHLQWLGVDAVWLSPIYPSPMADFGYDVSDYCDVHPLFGDLATFDRLLAEAHRRGLKVILDFVPNHTSDEHPWFAESRSSRTSPKRDWYIWRDPAPGGGPPNNWLSTFGGPAWTLDPASGQYYFHAFLTKQPDVNWRNPALREAMHDVLRFWLDRGVDGFRVDVIYHIVKDDQFRDNPRNPAYRPGQNPHHEYLATYITDRPEVHDVIAGMRRVVDAYPSRMMVGEVYLPVERLVTYYGEGGAGVHMPFNFQLVTMPWNARAVAEAIDHYEGSLPSYGWPNWVLGNHDNPRVASRVGRPQARVAAVLLLTLRGTPTLYYGDEIGMTDVPILADQVQDPFEKNVPGLGLGRDPERTPMQWDASPNAGFAPPAARPWLPVAADHAAVNVEVQRNDPASLLSLYRRLIAVRRAEPALAVGSYRPVPAEGDVVAYVRRDLDAAGGRAFLVVLNFGPRPQAFDLSVDAATARGGRVVVGTHPGREGGLVGGRLELKGDEAIVIAIGS